MKIQDKQDAIKSILMIAGGLIMIIISNTSESLVPKTLLSIIGTIGLTLGSLVLLLTAIPYYIETNNKEQV